MQFIIEGEIFDTQSMLNIEIDNIYVNLYILPERRLVFLQTFDDERGVSVSKSSPDHTALILQRLATTISPDISSFHDIIEAITGSLTPLPRQHRFFDRNYHPAKSA